MNPLEPMMPAPKPYLQSLLNRLGIYHRLKGSAAYDWYWSLADGRILDSREAEVTFYRSLLNGLGPGDLIFDIGANHGTKADIFLRLGARVVAVDPDLTNQNVLRQRFLQYRLRTRPVVIVGKAVSDREAMQTMWIDAPGSAKNTLSHKWVETLRDDDVRFGHKLDFAQHRQVETVTLEQLMDTYGTPFFVKIDVEGSEVNVLRGLQRPVPYLSFEVNLPQFKPEGFECIEQLQRVAADGRFNYGVDFRDGLMLESWRSAREFLQVFDRCTEESIEVFWTTTTAPPNVR